MLEPPSNRVGWAFVMSVFLFAESLPNAASCARQTCRRRERGERKGWGRVGSAWRGVRGKDETVLDAQIRDLKSKLRYIRHMSLKTRTQMPSGKVGLGVNVNSIQQSLSSPIDVASSPF